MFQKLSLTLVLIIGIAIEVSAHQGPDSTTRSLGLEYRFESGYSPNVGLTYKKIGSNPRNSIKVSVFVGSRDLGGANRFLYQGTNMLIYKTKDSAIPYLGVNTNLYGSTSYQRIEIGIERKFKVWKLNLISGVDGILGHRYYTSYGRVVEAELEQTIKNGIVYERYGIKNQDSLLGQDINYLNTSRNYLTFGVNARLGFLVNISRRLYASAFIGYRFEQRIKFRERFDYKNSQYKEHLPIEKGSDFFSVDGFSSVGLHYRF